MAVSFLRVPSPPHTALKTLARNLFSSSISASQVSNQAFSPHSSRFLRSYCLPLALVAASQMDSASTSAEMGASSDDGKKKVFVAGSTGRTGKKIVEQLLAKGFAVRAGALDLEKARISLPLGSSLDIVSGDMRNFIWIFGLVFMSDVL